MFKCIVFHFSNFSIENRIRSIDSKSLGNLQPRINLHLEVFQVGGMACRQFGLRFNRIKNDCSLWHDTGGGIFWQFLFLATLLFEYKKNQAWINGSHLSKLPSYRSKREKEREREKSHWFFTPKTVWLNFDLVATRKFSRGANIFL